MAGRGDDILRDSSRGSIYGQRIFLLDVCDVKDVRKKIAGIKDGAHFGIFSFIDCFLP